MRVTCPTCEAAYEVPAHLLSPTRRLKCAQCDSQWVPQMPGAEAVAVAPPPPPPAPEPAAAPPPPPPPPPPKPARVPEPEPVTASVGELRERVAAAERSEPPPKPRQPVLLTMAWAATFVLVASGFWGAYTYRGKVMQAWPPSQRAYAALGLDAEVK